MPSFSDSIVLFILALLLFGPKRLPKLARELGKWIGEFRRASNEFKMQMDDELRLTEQSDRQKEIAAMQAAAPISPPLPEPDQPGIQASSETPTDTSHPERSLEASSEAQPQDPEAAQPTETAVTISTPEPPAPTYELVDGVRRPIPIATSGDLHLMPPATGLPTARQSALGGLLDSIPETESPETAAHGD